MVRVLVLSVGYDDQLLRSRNQVLASKGFAVIGSSSVAEAARIFLDADVDIAILCHSIPEKERGQLVARMKHDRPLTPVLTIQASDAPAHQPLVDDTISALDPPDALLRHVEALVSSTRAYRTGT